MLRAHIIRNNTGVCMCPRVELGKLSRQRAVTWWNLMLGTQTNNRRARTQVWWCIVGRARPVVLVDIRPRIVGHACPGSRAFVTPNTGAITCACELFCCRHGTPYINFTPLREPFLHVFSKHLRLEKSLRREKCPRHCCGIITVTARTTNGSNRSACVFKVRQ